MLAWFTTILHHAEAIDPDLVERIRHEIDAITGFAPSTIVLVIGVLIVLFPVLLLGFYVVGPRAQQAHLAAIHTAANSAASGHDAPSSHAPPPDAASPHVTAGHAPDRGTGSIDSSGDSSGRTTP